MVGEGGVGRSANPAGFRRLGDGHRALGPTTRSRSSRCAAASTTRSTRAIARTTPNSHRRDQRRHSPNKDRTWHTKRLAAVPVTAATQKSKRLGVKRYGGQFVRPATSSFASAPSSIPGNVGIKGPPLFALSMVVPVRRRAPNNHRKLVSIIPRRPIQSSFLARKPHPAVGLFAVSGEPGSERNFSTAKNRGPPGDGGNGVAFVPL